jgi:hypothetical protein
VSASLEGRGCGTASYQHEPNKHKEFRQEQLWMGGWPEAGWTTHLQPSAPRLHTRVPGTDAPRHLQQQPQQHTTSAARLVRHTQSHTPWVGPCAASASMAAADHAACCGRAQDDTTQTHGRRICVLVLDAFGQSRCVALKQRYTRTSPVRLRLFSWYSSFVGRRGAGRP